MKCKKLPCQSDKGKSNTQSISIVINHFLSMSNFLIRPSQRFSFELNFFWEERSVRKSQLFWSQMSDPPLEVKFSEKKLTSFFYGPLLVSDVAFSVERQILRMGRRRQNRWNRLGLVVDPSSTAKGAKSSTYRRGLFHPWIESSGLPIHPTRCRGQASWNPPCDVWTFPQYTCGLFIILTFVLINIVRFAALFLMHWY